MRMGNAIAALLSLCACELCAQNVATNAAPETSSAHAVATNQTDKSWSFSGSVYTYVVHDDKNYAQPTVTADRDWLHLEARYNYEALKTASTWVGYNFSGGDRFSWEFTPMVGGIFGNLTGVAPGYSGSVTWWKITLYSEGEYVFDPGDSDNNFFYNWSELSLAPVEWFRFGMATQRTRAYESDREVQRGPLLGFTWKKLDFTTYMFNPVDGPTWVLAATLNF